MEVREFVAKIGKGFKTLIDEKPTTQTTERVCMSVDNTEFSIVHLNRQETLVNVKFAKTYRYDDIGNLPLILRNVVESNNLTNIPAFWLLQPKDYQLHLIDYLPVPDKELRNALNWRIRSLISYPITDTAIEYFKIPAKKSSPEHPMIAAVVAEKKQLEPIINIFNASHLGLTTIDIPELALRNLTALFEEDEKSTAMIYFSSNSIVLNITKHKALYFTRRIEFTYEATTNEQKYEALSLDILRYFDYFQSQWRMPSPSRIFVASSTGNSADIASTLTKFLMIDVEVFSLIPLLNNEKNIELIKPNLLLTFGCALREGLQYVPTRD